MTSKRMMVFVLVAGLERATFNNVLKSAKMECLRCSSRSKVEVKRNMFS